MIAENLVVERGVSAGDAWVAVEPASVKSALQSLKSDGFRLLVFLQLVYELRNMETKEQLRVRAFVDGDPPRIDSVHDIFPPANWEERETYDLFGVAFNGHPDLTRILMPDDWVGYPLRRDYPVGGEVVEFSEEHETWQTPPPDA